MNKITTFLITVLIASFSSCASSSTNGKLITMNVQDFEKAISVNQTQLVDVRTAAEYAQGHIDKSINIDVTQAGFLEQAKAKLNKEKPVYVYCHSGRRSLGAAKILAKAGFDVYDLSGGIQNWTVQGKPVK
ncbi:MAG: rhodanese-like domain-containing protein [Prevotella sp.]